MYTINVFNDSLKLARVKSLAFRYLTVASDYFRHYVNYFGIINKHALMYVTKAKYLEMCRNN